MELPIYQVDAFASAVFRGNPAAVCPLDKWLPDETLQAIALENNLSETAYYVRQGERYELRWFTPSVEVELCGHATLAAASVILGVRREISGPRVVFSSLGGELTVEREGDLYALDFPARPPATCETHFDLTAALGAKPYQILASAAPVAASQDYVCVFEREEQVRDLKPDMQKLLAVDRFAVIATAPGSDCDFVSRFFAPSKGIPEDPVTGRAHTTLIPYWSRQLGKPKLFARQISRRGRVVVRRPGHAGEDRRGCGTVPRGTHYLPVTHSTETDLANDASQRTYEKNSACRLLRDGRFRLGRRDRILGARGETMASNPGLGTLNCPSGTSASACASIGATPNDVTLTDGWHFGFRGGFVSGDHLGYEMGYIYNRTNLRFNEGGGAFAQQGMAYHQVAFNALYYFTGPDAKVRPFVTGGAGFTNYAPPGSSAAYGGGSTKLGVNYGGGVKIKLTAKYGLRFDVRQATTPKPLGLALASGWLRENEFSAGFGLYFYDR